MPPAYYRLSLILNNAFYVRTSEMCVLFQSDCQNYVRVFSPLEGGSRLLVCGTSAFNPKCRHYYGKIGPDSPSSSGVEAEFSGRGFVPFDPRHNSTALVAEDALYSGTVADFSGSDALVIRGRVRTQQYDLKHLNGEGRK